MQLECLYSEGNKFLKKIMVSAVITWKGVSQPFFTGGNGIKANGASYLKHLRDDLIPAVEEMYLNKDFTFSIAWCQSSAKLPEAEVGVQIC